MDAITSRRHPVVRECRRLARRADRDDPLVLLDGPHLIREALAAGARFRFAAFGASALGRSVELDGQARDLQQAGVEVVRLADEAFEAASPAASPAGAVAVIELPLTPLATVLQGDPILVAVGVQDPGNVGAVIRVAHAAGCSGAVVAGRSADPRGWKALRGSMGSTFRLPLAVELDVPGLILQARAAGLRIVATSPRGVRSLYRADLRPRTAMLLGGEGAGLAADVLALADEVLHIPMTPPVESLNVAVAAGLLAYEAGRQRGVLGGTPEGVR